MRFFSTLLLLAGLVINGPAQITLPPSGDNQKSTVTQYIGSLAKVTITYNSPDVHTPDGTDRSGKIWGQLVPFGMNDLGFGLREPAPWRAGANENTIISFSHDVLVQGQPLEAGTYGLHMIVEEPGKFWTLIFSRNHQSWGSYFYRESDDALRVSTLPEECAYQEWLTYEFIDRQPTFCTAALKWDRIQVPFKIEVPEMDQLYLANIRRELDGPAGFTHTSWQQAADFCAQRNMNLEEALQWAEKAISDPFFGLESFSTLQTKARLLDQLGRKEDAKATMLKAVSHPTASPFQVHQYGRQLIAEGQAREALDVFQQNFQRHNGAWPTHFGLARAFSALGKFDKALEHAEKALEQAPDELNRRALKDAIAQLKLGKDVN